jgi:hypothetical protein
MKKLLAAGTLILAMAIGTSAFAQEVAVGTAPPDAAGTYKPFVVGAYMGMGMAHSIGDNGDAKPRFAGEGGAYFSWYFMEILAAEGGISFVGKGARIDEEVAGVEIKARTKITYLEVPLGLKLNIKNFRAGVYVAIEGAIAGKTKVKEPDEDSDTWSGHDWDNTRRFNIAPKITLGYAIPVGPIAIVPGLSWSMHLLNDYDGPGDDAVRAMNLMFTAAVEFGFGSK